MRVCADKPVFKAKNLLELPHCSSSEEASWLFLTDNALLNEPKTWEQFRGELLDFKIWRFLYADSAKLIRRDWILLC